MFVIRALEGNEKLSWTIRKNPETNLEKGPFKFKTRTGVYYGYYPLIGEGEVNVNEFRVEFKPDLGRSIQGEEEQFSINHIAHPITIKGGIDNLLRSAYKNSYEEDGPVEIEFYVFSFKGIERIVTAFGLEVEDSHNFAYKIKQSFSTLYEALNKVIAFSYIFVEKETNKSSINKAVGCCNAAGIDYYGRYLIGRNLGQSVLFSTDEIKFSGGHTHYQRRRAVSDLLRSICSKEPGTTLIDLGAGSLFNLDKINNLYNTVIAVDYEFSPKSYKKAEESNIELVESSIKEFLLSNNPNLNNADILLMEVLEHNTKAQSVEILKRLIKSKVRNIIITVPNRDFNVNYSSLKGFRHADHLWEPNIKELEEVLQFTLSLGYSYEVRGIGDRVKAEYVSLMAILNRN